jgi:hypothetical protein
MIRPLMGMLRADHSLFELSFEIVGGIVTVFAGNDDLECHLGMTPNLMAAFARSPVKATIAQFLFELSNFSRHGDCRYFNVCATFGG